MTTEPVIPADGFDLCYSAGDLPLALGMVCADQIPPVFALPPISALVDEMYARLAAAGPPPYIGVTWRAGQRKHNHLSKIAPIEDIGAALAHCGATLIALQRNPEEGEIDTVAAAAGREVHDFTALNDDLESMLALLGALDDYVCVSNTNVHLMAARGLTCRVLVPFPPEYRWMNAGSESPWFPGTRVYRETRGGGWTGALEELGAEIAAAWPPDPRPPRRGDVE